MCEFVIDREEQREREGKKEAKPCPNMQQGLVNVGNFASH